MMQRLFFAGNQPGGGMWYNAVSGSAAGPEISGFRSGRDGHIKNMAGRGFPVRGEAMMQRLFFAGNRPRAGCGIMPFRVLPQAWKYPVLDPAGMGI